MRRNFSVFLTCAWKGFGSVSFDMQQGLESRLINIPYFFLAVHIPYLAEYLNRLPKWLLKILLPGLTYFREVGGLLRS